VSRNYSFACATPHKLSVCRVLISTMTLIIGCYAPRAAPAFEAAVIRLPGHVAHLSADVQQLPRTEAAGQESLTLTVAFNMPPSAEFDALKAGFHNPASPNFQRLIPADELTARFGPSPETYESIRAFLTARGFELIETAPNRRTMTVRGRRALVEQVFSVRIEDFQRGADHFHATLDDPAVPAELAPLIGAIDGLSSTLKPHPMNVGPPTPALPSSLLQAYNIAGFPGLTGKGQTIGLMEFANFDNTDIVNWLSFANLPASRINQISTVTIPSGAVVPIGTGNELTEVLGDIDTVLGIAPGANVLAILVNSSGISSAANYSQEYNSAVTAVQAKQGGLGGIISNSWTGCELDTPLAVAIQTAVQSILETAAMSGLSYFVASGDNGSQGDFCVGSGSNTNIDFPGDLAATVAVGGTSLITQATTNAYDVENWYSGVLGAGGFGTSRTVAAPVWQGYYTTAVNRSVPDVAADMDPSTGILLCVGTTLNVSGSTVPNCTAQFGGTSLAAPIWAASWALISQVAGPISAGEGNLYYMSLPPSLTNPATNCSYIFNSPACMMGPNNDFAHLGLGSPNIANLASYLSGTGYVTSLTPNFGSIYGGTVVTASGFFPRSTGTIFWIQGPSGWLQATTTSCASLESCTFTTPADSTKTPGTFSVAVSPPIAGLNSPIVGAGLYNSKSTFEYLIPFIPPPHPVCPPVCRPL